MNTNKLILTHKFDNYLLKLHLRNIHLVIKFKFDTKTKYRTSILYYLSTRIIFNVIRNLVKITKNMFINVI